MTTGVIIIGGDYRGLGAVRSLGRRGIPVWVLTDDHRLASTSRYVQRSLPWPAGSPDRADADRMQMLLDLSERCGLAGWMLLPTGDEAAALISRHHAQLAEHFVLTTPPWEKLRWAYDKRLTYQLAQQAGLEIPWTMYPAGREELATAELAFPILLKPAYKQVMNEFTHAKAWLAENRATLLARYGAACRLVDPDVIMLQELIPGGGESQYSFAALCQDGQALAAIVARRTRQYPLDFGFASTYVESVENAEVERSARRILAELRYDGLIEVEFKFDLRDGRYKLLDLNPRIWGWHTLGTAAGVDFTHLQWRLSCGETLEPACGRPGVHWVRMSTDAVAAVQYMRKGLLSPLGYLRSLSAPLESAIFALDDPMPGIVDGPLLAMSRLRRRMNKSA
jgi:D-aspartate ligase